MVGIVPRLTLAGLLCLALSGCVSSGPGYDSDYGPSAQRGARPAPKSGVLQCVPYARDHSQVKLTGDAYTWWDKAEGRYVRGYTPAEGAVMVLYNYAGPNRGHVAVVREITDPREIRVDHANWLDDGAIYTDDPVRDVSPANDWSLVRVFNQRTGAWGTKLYPVQGFIGPGRGDSTVPSRSPEDVPVAEGGRKRDAIAALLADDVLDDALPN
ncbi:surface antigen [Rhizomicrobium palustre]|uniref:Surface antigen n=1 Tax=Rhizomicrobium palustre TaxID=189966 RepID=A0A846MXI7_9PROT|nr:CHAP domain-containing protein [Rhizomicrobium palustre]NIK88288.1 surface antigen [Rhizomicrobium palustre]